MTNPYIGEYLRATVITLLIILKIGSLPSAIRSEIQNFGLACLNLCEQENDTNHQHATSQDMMGVYLFGSQVDYQHQKC